MIFDERADVSKQRLHTASVRRRSGNVCASLEGVDGWIIGLIALCIVGIALIGFGAFWDRRRHRQAAIQMLSPPARDIPQLPTDVDAPVYLSAVQARRRPSTPAAGRSRDDTDAARTGPDADDRTQPAGQLEDDDTIRIAVGYASPDFVTDPTTRRAVLDEPRVLVTAEPVMAIRELIGPLEHMLADGSPLVIVVPSMAPDVLDTLEVNLIQRRLQILVVWTTAPEPADDICAATGARLLSRVDLQSGYVTDADLGHCRRWVCDRDTSYVMPAGAGNGTDPHQP